MQISATCGMLMAESSDVFVKGFFYGYDEKVIAIIGQCGLFFLSRITITRKIISQLIFFIFLLEWYERFNNLTSLNVIN